MADIDKVLEQQSRVPFLVAIDNVEGSQDLIKVTPWSSVGGCNCQNSLVIPKNAVEGIVPTQIRHPCCGKVFIVVDLQIKEDATMRVKDVLERSVMAANAAKHDHHDHNGDSAAPQPRAVNQSKRRLPEPTAATPTH
jgi:hypothetical protein